MTSLKHIKNCPGCKRKLNPGEELYHIGQGKKKKRACEGCFDEYYTRKEEIKND